MREKLNPEKSKRLRPLRILLAILIAILIVLILDRLPTSVKDRPSQSHGEQASISGQPAPEGFSYYYFSGILDILEDQIGAKLDELGVSEDDYGKVEEYFTEKEILELEARITLAGNLESIYVLSNEDDVNKLRKIFDFPEDESFDKYIRPSATPSEYKDLSDLLEDYFKAISTVEDYDTSVEQ
ncbi:hypothetical protein IKG31_01450 [Candidatus Saccharibacteria bacterium]|nr:hypothetical protein [Candidatus Saccharibacteria bacterium]